MKNEPIVISLEEIMDICTNYGRELHTKSGTVNITNGPSRLIATFAFTSFYFSDTGFREYALIKTINKHIENKILLFLHKNQ